jgi:hypothetical protein
MGNSVKNRGTEPEMRPGKSNIELGSKHDFIVAIRILNMRQTTKACKAKIEQRINRRKEYQRPS